MSRRSYVPLNTLALDSAPAGEFAGDLYFDTSENVLKAFTGTEWISASSTDDSDSQEFSTTDLLRLTEGLDGGQVALVGGAVYVTEQTRVYFAGGPDRDVTEYVDGGCNAVDYPNIDGGSLLTVVSLDAGDVGVPQSGGGYLGQPESVYSGNGPEMIVPDYYLNGGDPDYPQSSVVQEIPMSETMSGGGPVVVQVTVVDSGGV